MCKSDRKLYMKEYYLKNKLKIKEYYLLQSLEQKELRLQTIRNLKKRYGHLHKAELIIRKGGQCSRCGYKYDGYNGACFDFHHTNPEEKDFNITTYLRLYREIPDKIYQEVDKCVLVCANCHRILHSDKY